MHYFYAVVLFVYLFLASWSTPLYAQTSEGLVPDSTELRVLRQFYYQTGGPQWHQQGNWLQGNTLQQAGNWANLWIEDGDVVRLDFLANNLTGQIPACLGELRGLRNLALWQNQLSGPIPAELGQLSRLQGLALQQNQLSGPLPASLGQLTELRYVNLYANAFSGPVPATWQQLTQLEYLSLNGNRLSGALPEWLSRCANLTTLDLGVNQFTGPLPASYGNLTKLVNLQLWQNNFQDSIPAAWGGMRSLQQLSMAQAGVLGRLPQELGQLQELRAVNFYGNGLKGPLPASLGNWHKLVAAGFSWNQLSGPLPASLGQLSQLQELVLDNNQLSGPLPAELTQLANLDLLYLQNNQLSGWLPTSFGQLGRLRILSLAGNRFTGPLPASFPQLRYLSFADLSRNRFTGSLPNDFGQLQSLTITNLSDNLFSGPLPASLGQMTRLEYFYATNNQLSGPLPAELGQATNLLHLTLAGNRFSGTLPASVQRLPRVSLLTLDGNQLTGVENAGSGPFPASLGLARNQLDFAALEALLRGANQPKHANLERRWQQPKAEAPQTKAVVKGQLVTLDGTLPGQHNRYQWERKVGPAWVELPGQTQPTYTLTVSQEAQEGEYRTRVINDWVPELTLYARSIHLSLLPYAPLPYNEPVAAGCPTPADVMPPVDRSGATDQVNYVRTYTARQAFTEPAALKAATRDGIQVKTEYLDGLGRPVQTVLRQESPAGRDLVQPVAYDALGRQPKQYLPYTAAATADGAYQPNALRQQHEFYRGTSAEPAVQQLTATLPKTSFGYSETVFEASPLSRPQVQASPGESWQLSANHAVTLEERPNTTEDAVQRWQPGYDTEREDLVPQGAYAPGELWVKQTTDEQGQRVLEFTDKEGHVMLKRVQVREQEQSATPTLTSGTVCGLGLEGQMLTLTAPAGTVFTGIQAAWYGTGTAGSSCETFAFTPGCSADVTAQVRQLLASALAQGTNTLQLLVSNTGVGDPCGGYVKTLRLTATYAAPLPESSWLSTYYVYDDFGRLRAVLPPKAVEQLQRNSLRQWAVEGAGVERLLFRYHYDAQGRLVEKKVPDQDGYSYTVYNELDQPILTQDVAQQAQKEWVSTKYDALGRVVYTALVRFPGLSGTAEQQHQRLQQLVTDANTQSTTPLWEVPSASPTLTQAYYSHTSFPDLTREHWVQLLTVSYYDSYDFDQNGQADASYQAPTAAELACAESEVPQADLRVTGQTTRTKVRVLGVEESAPGAWLTTTSFFDEKLRPIQVQSTNARGGTELVSTRYDFTGKALASYAVHQVPQQPTRRVREQSRYDHAGRLLTVTQELENAPAQVLARHRYNELGQLEQKELGGRLVAASAGAAVVPPLPGQAGAPAALQTVDYRYNIRGWLTGINDVENPNPQDLWNFALSYDCGFETPQYNGNIAGQRWRSVSDGIERAYGYRYDKASRLLQGDFVARTTTSPTSSWGAERSNYRFWAASYDAGGNLLTLRRRGLVAGATRTSAAQYAETDNLRYRYEPSTSSEPGSNRLQRVDDLAPAATAFGGKLPERPDFSDGTTSGATSPDYTYDAAGSMTSDKNKGISRISYNYLHLPELIEWSNGNKLQYVYTATGQKVAKLATAAAAAGKPASAPVRTDYLGAWQYEKDSLRWLTHAEGRALLLYGRDAAGGVTAKVQYEYTLKDHLGNLRVAFHPGERRSVLATMEESQRDREIHQFDSASIESTRTFVGPQFGHNGTSYVAKLTAGGTQPKPLGPLKQLSVARGDTILVTAYGLYNEAPKQNNWGFSLAGFVASLLQQQPAATPPSAEGTRRVRVLPLLSAGLTAAALPMVQQLTSGVPKAYLRILVFNSDSVLVANQPQPQLLTKSAEGNYEQLQLSVVVPQAGYVQAYVANESDTDVFFDDITVEHRQGLQVQENQYDPYGLDLAGLSKAATPQNQYTWNGKEKQTEFGLNWHDHGWRFYDPTLGRWVVSDPDAEEGDQEGWGTYQFGLDNAVRYNDLDGRQAGPPITSETNPLSVMAEGFRQYFQAVGGTIDKTYASFSTTASTLLNEAKGVLGMDISTSVDVTKTVTVRPNVSNYMALPRPTGPLVRVEKTTTVTKNTKIQASVKARYADVKVSTVYSKNLVTGEQSVSSEVAAEKKVEGPRGTSASGGLFVSSKVANGKTKIDVGAKAGASIKQRNTTFSIGAKVGATLLETR